MTRGPIIFGRLVFQSLAMLAETHPAAAVTVCVLIRDGFAELEQQLERDERRSRHEGYDS